MWGRTCVQGHREGQGTLGVTNSMAVLWGWHKDGCTATAQPAPASGYSLLSWAHSRVSETVENSNSLFGEDWIKGKLW